jgi:hypothetical protein
MRTPFGVDCKYFYGDYYRGREQEECRLIPIAPPPNNWTSAICKNCPVPGILRANACKNMVLEAHIEKGLLGIKKRVTVSAYCTQSKKIVDQPYIGCGECHPLDIQF